MFCCRKGNRIIVTPLVIAVVILTLPDFAFFKQPSLQQFFTPSVY